MDSSYGPGVRRRVVGKRLRKLREQQELTTTEVARKLQIAQPTLTRIEGGRTPISPQHVSRLCAVYAPGEAETDRLIRLAEQSRERGWWESYSDVIHDWFEIFASLESDVDQILLYESEFVPGIFRTPGYLRAVYSAVNPDADENAVNRQADLILARQLRLSEHKITALINEAAVHRMVGGQSVMLDQLHHLINLIEQKSVDIRIVPFSAGAHAAMKGPFSLLKFPDAEEIDLVYVENERSGMYFERAEDLLRYTDIFSRTREVALDPGESAALFGKIAQDL